VIQKQENVCVTHISLDGCADHHAPKGITEQTVMKNAIVKMEEIAILNQVC